MFLLIPFFSESAREGDAMRVEMIGLKSGKEEAERMREFV